MKLSRLQGLVNIRGWMLQCKKKPENLTQRHRERREKSKRDFSLRRPTFRKSGREEKASACFGRNDGCVDARRIAGLKPAATKTRRKRKRNGLPGRNSRDAKDAKDRPLQRRASAQGKSRSLAALGMTSLRIARSGSRKALVQERRSKMPAAPMPPPMHMVTMP
jgi:hypothetical protein